MHATLLLALAMALPFGRPTTAAAPASDDASLTAARVEQLVAELEHADAAVRRRAAGALGSIGPAAKSAVGALLEATRDPVLSVQSNAVEALGRIGPEAKAAFPRLLDVVNDPEPEMRMLAAEALGRIGPAAKVAVPRLIGALNDEFPDVRVRVVVALGGIGPDSARALPRLCELLGNDCPEVRRVIPGALAEMGAAAEPAYTNLATASTGDMDEAVRIAAKSAASRILREVERADPARAAALRERELEREGFKHRVKGDDGVAPAVGLAEEPTSGGWPVFALLAANILLFVAIVVWIRRRAQAADPPGARDE
jgi:HEAT repeat protein